MKSILGMPNRFFQILQKLELLTHLHFEAHHDLFRSITFLEEKAKLKHI